MACDTEGFLPPKVMVRPTSGCTPMALKWSTALSWSSPRCPHPILGLGWGLQGSTSEVKVLRVSALCFLGSFKG